jgi:hypothetical protein
MGGRHHSGIMGGLLRNPHLVRPRPEMDRAARTGALSGNAALGPGQARRASARRQSNHRTKREDELKRIPAQSGRSDLPPGKLRSISMDEIDLLQIDRNGRLYCDGKPVEVSRRLTFWQSVGAFIVGTFVVIGSVDSFLQGWTVYHDLACRMGWYTFAVTCVPM